MRFSAWLESRIAALPDPNLERLKRDERMLLASIENRKGHGGVAVGINAAGIMDAMNKLKEVRGKIEAIEKKGQASTKPLPAWIQGKRAV